jgi:hypothetical protein
MGHLLPVHEAHQLAHEPFYPKSLIPPRCPCTQSSIMPRCRWSDLRPASSGRTCAQTPPSSSSPAPLRPPPCHRSLCSCRRHLPSSRRHHLPSLRRHHCLCSRRRHPFSCRAFAASSHVAPSLPPLTSHRRGLRRRRLWSRRAVSSAHLTQKTKVSGRLNPLECLAA